MNQNALRQYSSPLVTFLRRYGFPIGVVLLVVFAGIFLLSGRGEIAEAAQLLGAVSPVWIGVLAALQLMVITIAALTYQVLLRRQGHSVGLLRLAEIHLQRVLVGAVTPVGGPASLYVFARSLKDHGVSGNNALITASMRSVAGAVAFLLLLVPALLLQDPSRIVTIAAASMVVVLSLLLVSSALLLRQDTLPESMERWAPNALLEFIVTAKSHRIRPSDFALPVALGFTSHVTVASMLYIAFQALGYGVPAGTVLIGYVIGKLFFMMAPFFQGIGVVELGMALALQQAGIPAVVAVSAALLYRVGDLWLPLSWAIAIQVVRLRPVESCSKLTSRAAHRFDRFINQWPVRSPLVGRQVVRMGQLALVMEAMLVLAVGTWVTYGNTLLLMS